jgi:UDP-glucose:glycoprotein glucosyltransferase
LVRARQIPEWDTYDQEIAAFASRLAGGAGGSLAISVDDLAAEKKVVVEEEAVEAAETSDPEDVAVDEGRSHLDDEL